MNQKKILAHTLTAGVLMIAAVSSHAQARSLTLNPPAAGDLHADALTQPPAMPLANERRESVSFSWVVPVLATDAVRAPHEAVSRSFTQRVSAKAFAQGVTIVTDAPGAVLRVSASKGRLDAERLFVGANGRRQTLAAMTDQLVNTDDLRAAGMDGAASVIGARLTSAAGEMRLSYDGALADDTAITISVLDRNSATTLAVQSQADHFADGSVAAVSTAWKGADRRIDWSGHAVSPDGRTYPLVFDRDGRGTLATRAAPATVPGLWEWRIRGVDAHGLVRDASTAFAMSPPVARLGEQVQVTSGRAGTDVTVHVHVSAEGRYEVRGTLTDDSGSGQAVIAARAQWLSPGSSTLTLSFAASDLKRAGLRGTLRLTDLTLSDQSRMSVQGRRAHALTF